MTTMIRRSPLDLFAPFLGARWADVLPGLDGGDGDRLIQPALDVSESETGYTIATELPGLKKDDVAISIEDGVLTISGEKRFEEEQKDKSFHRIERRYGAFRRTVTLPSGIDLAKAEATMADGVLRIQIPKSESAKPKSLTIK